VIRIGNLESNLNANVIRIGNLESNLNANVIRIGNLESNLNANVIRIGNLESNLSANVIRIGNLESNLSANVIRIGNLESNLSDNVSRIETLETKTTDISYTNGTTRINGNLTVLGNTTTLDTVNLIVQDPILQLSNASASVDSGILIARPSTTDNVFVGFDQSLSEFAIGFTDSHAGLNEIVVKDGQDFTLNVHGNVEASYYFGDGSQLSGIQTATPTLASVVDVSNATSNVVRFTNTTTGIEMTSNIDFTNNIILKSTNGTKSNLFVVNAIHVDPDYASPSNNVLSFNTTTGEIYDSGGTGFSGDIADYITHTSDSDTYFGFPGDNQFKIRTGGTDRLNIDNTGITTIPDYIRHSGGDTDTYFGFPSDDTFTITTSNTERFRINSIGEVVIGTVTTGYSLNVNGKMNIASGLSANGSTGSNGQVLTSSGGGAMSWTTVSSSPWTTSGSNIYRSSGNVGIGVTNPGAPLQIAASGSANPLTNGILVKNSSNSTNQDSIVTLQVGGSSAGDPFISFDILGEAGWAFGIDNTDSNKLKWSASYGALSNTKMTMTTAGDLGIYKLDVQGTMQLTSGLRVSSTFGTTGQVLTSSGGGAMTWTTVSSGGSSPWTTLGSDIYRSSGNVGIGTSSPVRYLDVSGSVSASSGGLLIRNGDSNAGVNNAPQIAFGWSGNDQYQHFIQTRHNNGVDDNAIDFYVCDGTQNNSLASGTTHNLTLESGYKLDVQGTMQLTSGLRVSSTFGTTGQVLTSSGGGAMTWSTVSGGGSFSGDIADYITHTGNTSNDLFGFPNNNEFKIRTGGIDRLIIDSIGNLTIPDYIRHSGDTNTYFGFSSTDTFVVSTSGSVRFLVNAIGEGTIGLNTGMGSGHMFSVVDGSTINNGSYADLVVTNMSEHNNARILLGTPHQTTSSSAFKAAIIADGAGTYSRNDLHFCLENSTDNTANADLTDSKMVIKYDTGNVGIGITSPAHKLHVVGDIYASGNVTAYSDARNKKNLKTIEDPVSKIEKINGYTYEKDGIAYTGLIAQELLEVLPEAVCGSEESGYGIAYGNIAGIFVEAIKELNSKIKELENKLNQFV
jgi:hypothetical protein